MDILMTGSRVYGTPHEKSDYDLVMLVDEDVLKFLEEASGASNEHKYILPERGEGKRGIDRALRFGSLNLLLVTSPEAFAVWVEGTDTLTLEKPVDRTRAVEVFSGLRKERGLGIGIINFTDIISSHRSRSAARAACKRGQRVIRAGRFGNGRFGLFAPLKANGQPVGGRPDPQIVVWHVVKN
jgi:hypothetical protein